MYCSYFGNFFPFDSSMVGHVLHGGIKYLCVSIATMFRLQNRMLIAVSYSFLDVLASNVKIYETI